MIKASMITLATIVAGSVSLIPQDYTTVNQNNNCVMIKSVQNWDELQEVLSELGISFEDNCFNWNIPNLY